MKLCILDIRETQTIAVNCRLDHPGHNHNLTIIINHKLYIMNHTYNHNPDDNYNLTFDMQNFREAQKNCTCDRKRIDQSLINCQSFDHFSQEQESLPLP